MPYPHNPAVYEWSNQLVGGPGSGPFYNVFHVASPTLLTPSNVTAINGAFNAFYNAIKVYLGNTLVATCGYKVIQFDTPPLILGGTPASTNGTAPGALGVPQNAAVVSWRTPNAGRSYRGRTFVGPLAQSAVSTTGGLNSSFQSTLQTAASALPGAITAAVASANLVIYSHKLNTYTGVANAFVGGNMKTMRSRG